MRRLIASLVVVSLCVISASGQDVKDTDKAASTRKLLDTKISVDYSDTLLQDVIKDLSDKAKDAAKTEFPTKIDNASGASNNMKITFTAKDMTVSDVLDGIGKKYDLGYIIISGKYKTFTKYDGYVLVVKGKERGYPEKAAKGK